MASRFELTPKQISDMRQFLQDYLTGPVVDSKVPSPDDYSKIFEKINPIITPQEPKITGAEEPDDTQPEARALPVELLPAALLALFRPTSGAEMLNFTKQKKPAPLQEWSPEQIRDIQMFLADPATGVSTKVEGPDIKIIEPKVSQKPEELNDPSLLKIKNFPPTEPKD